MELSTDPIPLQPISPLLPVANTSNAGFRFLGLPLELRLLIYHELLVQSDDLLRTFCTCKFCANRKSRTIGRDCLNPSLLRTSKTIYSEALPILYSKNVFSFLCYGPFADSGPISVSGYRRSQPRIMARATDDGLKTGPLANRHSVWAGVTRIITCPSDAAKPHVRRISLQLSWVYHRILDGFPTQWWQPMERDVLHLFPGLEQIVVQIPLRVMAVSAFCMVLQRKDLMAERRQNYKSILADSALFLRPIAKAREVLRNLEAICDAVITSHAQGEMKKCAFGVKLVSWTVDYLLAAGPEPRKDISTNIHLGCR